MGCHPAVMQCLYRAEMWGPRAGQAFFRIAFDISSWPGVLLLARKMAWCASQVAMFGKGGVASGLLQLMGISSVQAV